MNNNTTKAALAAALGNIFWGFSFLFIKVALDVASEPYIMLGHRFTIATLIMVGVMLFGKGKLSFKGKNWRPAVLLILMQQCYYLFETYGILYTNSTISGLVLAVVPVVTIGTGALFLKEYPTKRQMLFCILPVAGVIIISISGQELGVINFVGGVFLLLTMLASAFFKTANRQAAKEFSPFERTFLILAASSVTFNLVGLNAVDWNVGAFLAPLLDIRYRGSVLALSVLCSIAANMLVNYATTHISVFKVSSFGSLSTLCSSVAGIVFLREPVSVSLVVGAILILVGVRQVTKPK